MIDIILSSEMEDFYNQLNALRDQFSLSQITPPADYQKNTIVKAEQWNTLLDNVDATVNERNLEYTTKPEKVAQEYIIKKDNTKVLLQENIDFMKTLCVNYSVDVNICTQSTGNSKQQVTTYSESESCMKTCIQCQPHSGCGGAEIIQHQQSTSYNRTTETSYTNRQICNETYSYATCTNRVNP